MNCRILWALSLVITCSTNQQRQTTTNNYILGDLTRCRAVSPDVLIWVQGRATAPQQRAMIRETMANSKLWPANIKVMTMFLAGKPTEKEFQYQSLLEYEFEKYRDIIQTDIPEGYKNLVYKTISGINYISDYCFNLKLIIKMDDDVVFHPHLLLDELLPIMTNNSGSLESISAATLACNLHAKAKIHRKKDHPRDYYTVDSYVLPGREWYPPFCAGFFAAMAGDVPRLLQPHIAVNKPFWMEDRYMGVLQEQAQTDYKDLYSMLDYGYHNFTQENITSMADKEILAQHLPSNLERHILQIFQYLDSDFKQTFSTIEMQTLQSSNKPKSGRSMMDHRREQYQQFSHQQQQKRRRYPAHRNNKDIVERNKAAEIRAARRPALRSGRRPPHRDDLQSRRRRLRKDY